MLVQDELLQPPFFLGVWSLFCIFVVAAGIIALVFYMVTGRSIFSYFKGKNTKALLFFLAALGLNGCSQDSSTSFQPKKPVDQLVADFQLSRVTSSSSVNQQDALHFKTVEQARTFLDILKSQQGSQFAEADQKTVDAYLEGATEQQKRVLDNLNPANHFRVQDYDGNEGNETPPPGSGSFSQQFFPWNKVSMYVTWDDQNNITGVQSFLTGVTLGLGWNQIGYNTSNVLNNGAAVIKVTYTYSVVLFVEGVGTIWTSSPTDAYVVVFGGEFSAGAPFFSGRIFPTYDGAYNFGVRIVGQN